MKDIKKQGLKAWKYLNDIDQNYQNFVAEYNAMMFPLGQMWSAIAAMSVNLNNGKLADLNKKYKERFNQLPDLQAALAYDGVRLIHEAMRRAQNALPAKIRATLGEMTTTSFDKSLSGSWTFDKNHAARRPLFVGPLANSKVSNPKRYEPDGK